MEIGIGPLELFFIILIALIVLGPRDMVKAGRTLGRLLRRLVTSPTWQTVQQTSRDLRRLPTKLMREAGMEEAIASIPNPEQIMKEVRDDLAAPDLEGKPAEIYGQIRPPETIESPPPPQREETSSQVDKDA